MNRIWQRTKEYIRSVDVLLLLAVLACSAISLAALYSMMVTGQPNISRKLVTQAVGVGIGLAAALVISRFDYEELANLWKLYVPIILILMLLLWTPLGVEGLEGADDRAWLDFKLFTIQPSEFMKLAFILTFSLHLTKTGEQINRRKPFLKLCLHGAVPCVLVMATGDYGTALVFLLLFVTMMFVAGLSAKWIGAGLLALLMGAPVIWFFVLPDYLKERFMVAFEPEKYLGGSGRGYQQYHGRIGLGSGGLFGRGFAQENLYNVVPVDESDFIFSYIGQIFGFVGALAVLLLIALVCVKILMTARMSRDRLGSFLCCGVFSMFFFQSVINLGMVLCVSPVIGITLPFFSYGGTSMVASYLAIGLVLAVYQKHHKDMMFD